MSAPLFPLKQIVDTLRQNPNILTNSFVIRRKLSVMLTVLFVIRTNILFWYVMIRMDFLHSVYKQTAEFVSEEICV